jgi:hypothetical protein
LAARQLGSSLVSVEIEVLILCECKPVCGSVDKKTGLNGEKKLLFCAPLIFSFRCDQLKLHVVSSSLRIQLKAHNSDEF